MYPQMNTNINYKIVTDMSNISVTTDENKELCKDLCKVGICISCFCGIYLIFFFRIIHEELSIDNITYF